MVSYCGTHTQKPQSGHKKHNQHSLARAGHACSGTHTDTHTTTARDTHAGSQVLTMEHTTRTRLNNDHMAFPKTIHWAT